MLKTITDFFHSQKIEYFSVLDYRDCNELNAELIAREGFTPKSVILFLIPYYAGRAENFSTYAASLDYHIIIRTLTDALIDRLKSDFPDGHFCGYGDHSPIDERHAAAIAGLGIKGDSTLLINEKYGTYVFIADIVTDVPPEALGAIKPQPLATCSHCGACRRACPTGILRGECDKCLSAITQRKGELDENELELMRKFDTVWGCDVCQTVCPHNRHPEITPIEFFHKDRIEYLTSDILTALTKDELKSRAFGWRGRKTIERNLKALDY